MKRTLCLFLALILAVGICFSAPVTITASAAFTLESGEENTVGAEYTDEESKFEYRITKISGDKAVAVIGFTGSETEIEIPATVTINENEYSVTAIGNNAFADCTSLAAVTIPDSVTTIGDFAFANCTSLAAVTIPDSIKTIDYCTFYFCTALTSVTIGKGVTEIDGSAFYSCTALTSIEVDVNNSTYLSDDNGVLFNKDKTELICYPVGKTATSYTIPDGVKSIGDIAFYDCKSLTTIEIPDSVETIGSYAFNGCRALASVTIPDSVETIGSQAFSYCTSLRTVSAPCSWNEKPLYTFEDWVDVVIPKHTIENNNCTVCKGSKCGATESDTVTWVYDEGTLYINGTGAMVADYDGSNMPWYSYQDKITKIIIENGVTTIGMSAFSGCDNLTSVTIPKSVTTIGSYAFYKCTLLASIEIPQSVTTIYGEAFSGCTALSEITIPNSVTTIGDSAFYNCTKLPRIEIPDSVTTIGNYAFEGCTSLKSVTIGESVTTIGESAFAGCTSLTSVTIPYSVTSIGKFAFYDCTSLTSVTIGKGVTEIGDCAFDGCNILSTVNVPCSWNENPKYTTFENSVTVDIQKHNYELGVCTACKYDCTHVNKDGNGICTVCYIAEGTCGASTNDGGESSVEWLYDSVSKTLTISGSGAMADETPWEAYLEYIRGIDIKDGVTSIGDFAFWGFESLTSVTIPDSIKTIGVAAFQGCFKLTSVTIPERVKSIGDDAFYGCEDVKLIVEPGSYAHEFAITNSILYTFKGYNEAETAQIEKLTFTEIRNDNEVIAYSVTGCDTSISGELKIPATYNGKPVTKIGNGAFANCESLTSVVIPDSVVSLGEMVFYSCDSLETVTLSSNITVIPDEAFAYCSTLKTLPITENVTSIGESAFYASGKHSKVSLSGVTIGSEAFLQCGITELTLVKCTLNNANVFINNKIEELTLSETNIPDEMFKSHSYLKTLVAEDSVLGSRSFAGCTELENVTVSGGEINNTAFMNCSSLETVTIDNIDSIGENAFCCCIALNSVVLGDGLETIEFGAFVDCNSLETIELPEGLTTIDESAFSGCKRLKKVTIPKSVTKIGVGAFEVCTSLAEVEISEGVTTIGNRAFQFCEALTEIIIPKSVTSIDAEAFFKCSNLKYVFFEGTEDSQKTIGDALETNAKIHYGSSTHTFNEIYTVDLEPTCTEKGSESQHCKYCDLTQNSKEIKENGHTSVNGGTEKAHTICDVCEEILSATHNPTSKVTKEPTSTEEGVKTYTCECGYSYEEVIPCLVPGEIEAEDADSNSFSATVVDINSIVTKLQLTEEERALIEQGADMKIVFKLSDIGATINTPEKEAIFKALTNEKIAVFLDIQLVKQIANNSVNVQKLNGLIKVTVELPSEFISKDGNVKRSYSVLRYHDGDETKVTTLNAKFDETTGTLTFETDRFSTYAIVYSDVVVSAGEGVPGTPDPGDGEVSTPENPKDETTPGTPETPKDDVSNDKNDDSVTNDKNDASSETGTNDKNDTSKDDVPKAGVISTTSIWLGAMALSGLGALLVSKKKKEND